MKGTKLNFAADTAYHELSFREVFLTELELAGTTILEPSQNELFIDIDTEEDFIEFQNRLRCLNELTAIVDTWKATPSKNGLPHRHVIVKLLLDISDEMRIAVQAVLNSDPMREFLCTCRTLNHDLKANVLFKYSSSEIASN